MPGVRMRGKERETIKENKQTQGPSSCVNKMTTASQENAGCSIQ